MAFFRKTKKEDKKEGEEKSKKNLQSPLAEEGSKGNKGAKKVVDKVGEKESYLYSLIEQPRLSEKALNLASLHNQYVFNIRNDANKTEVKKAVEKIFNVKVVSVNITKRPHKNKNLRGIRGKKGAVKKAVVKLKEGDKINIYPEQKQ